MPALPPALDIPVAVIAHCPRILDFVDQEIAEALSYQMRSQGVTFRLGEEVEEVTKSSEPVSPVELLPFFPCS